jgi:hypothetical protein
VKTVTVSGVRGYLLLFSHMRAYTSLLGHIVGSHAEITGYSEMHLRLRDQRALHKLAQQVARRSQKNYRGRYVFDKLLHNHLDTRRKVLRRNDVYPLIMVRHPKETIESILRLKARFIDHPGVAEQYYLQRLQQLRQVVQWCDGECLFIQGEALVDQTDRVLEKITQWLQLESPLNSQYDRFQHTGKRRLGDSSEHIFAGKVLPMEARKRDDQDALDLDLGEISGAVAAYEAFLAFISGEVAADKTVFT